RKSDGSSCSWMSQSAVEYLHVTGKTDPRSHCGAPGLRVELTCLRDARAARRQAMLSKRMEGMQRVLPAAMVVGMAVAAPGMAAQAEAYPAKPIRIVVPFSPGGSNDLVGRVIAQKFTEAWGKPVIIDNRPGGGSTIGIELVARA